MRKTTLSKAVMRMLSLFTAFTMTFTSVDLTALAASGTDPAEPEETLESEVQDESVIPSGDDEDSDGIKEDEPGEPAEGDDEDSEGSEDPEEIIDEEAAEEPEEEPASDETEITDEAAAEDAEEDTELLGEAEYTEIPSDDVLVQDTYYYDPDDGSLDFFVCIYISDDEGYNLNYSDNMLVKIDDNTVTNGCYMDPQGSIETSDKTGDIYIINVSDIESYLDADKDDHTYSLKIDCSTKDGNDTVHLYTSGSFKVDETDPSVETAEEVEYKRASD